MCPLLIHIFPFTSLANIPGPKACDGYSSTDNGFARFDRVRIPKENMLSRFAQVTSQGAYIQPPHAKSSYGGVSALFADLVMKSLTDDAVARCFTCVQRKLLNFFVLSCRSCSFGSMVISGGWYIAKGLLSRHFPQLVSLFILYFSRDGCNPLCNCSKTR